MTCVINFIVLYNYEVWDHAKKIDFNNNNNIFQEDVFYMVDILNEALFFHF